MKWSHFSLIITIEYYTRIQQSRWFLKDSIQDTMLFRKILKFFKQNKIKMLLKSRTQSILYY